MTGAFEVEWSEAALEDWGRLSFAEAEAIARAVESFARTGEGRVVYVDGEYVLFADDLVAIMLIDRERLYVDRVRTALPRGV